MKAVIDGVVYQYQQRGGISRLYNEILPRMCDLDPSLRISLLTTGRCRQSLPTHDNIQHHLLFPIDDLLRPRRFWWPVLQEARALLQHQAIGSASGRIWHSTFYTLPGRWDGPVVVTVFDMIHERFPDFFSGSINDQFRQQKRRCVLNADRVICISETTKQDVIDLCGLDAAKVHTVPLACSPVFRQVDKTDPAAKHLLLERPFILYVGNRAGYKNFAVLLRAYLRWDHRSQVDLAVVGPSWSKAEKAQLTAIDCAERVHLLGHVDDYQLRILYNNALAFVFPSLYEGFGIPLLEAMACGCPVVAAQIPSTMEIVDQCPVYFEPADGIGLIAALDIVLEEGRDSQRVKLGLEKVSQYSWGRTAQETLGVYCDLRTCSEL